MYLKRLTGMALEQLQEVFGPPGDGAAELNGVGADEKGSRAQLGPFRTQQSLANGAGQGAPVATGPHKQTTLAQKVGERDAVQMAPI